MSEALPGRHWESGTPREGGTPRCSESAADAPNGGPFEAMAAQEADDAALNAAVAAGEALASASAALEAPHIQEDISPALLAEFLKDSRKKEKLLWGQLQVVDDLQEFMEHMDMTMSTEEEIRAQASANQELWKDLKAEHQDQVEAIENALPHALEQLEASQKKQALLGSTLEQVQAKKQALEEQRIVARARQRQEQEKLAAKAQSQREVLEDTKKQYEQVLTVQGEEQKTIQGLQTFQGLLETLHDSGRDGGNQDLSGAPAQPPQ